MLIPRKVQLLLQLLLQHLLKMRKENLHLQQLPPLLPPPLYQQQACQMSPTLQQLRLLWVLIGIVQQNRGENVYPS
jgi:hypothetical protein